MRHCTSRVNLFIFLLAFSSILTTRTAHTQQRIPPPTGCWLGVSLGSAADPNQEQHVDFKTFYDATGRRLCISNVFLGFPNNWGATPEYADFPQSEADAVLQESRCGIIMLTIEPWSNFELFYTGWHIGNPAFDATERLAAACSLYNQRVLIRFAHEMNGNWYPWGRDSVTQQNYRTAFVNFATMFASLENVGIVWCPNYASSDDFGNYMDWYPGDEVVDWVGIDYYHTSVDEPNFELRRVLTRDDFYRIFCDSENSDGHRKPLIICETGCRFPDFETRIIDGFESFNPDRTPIDWDSWSDVNKAFSAEQSEERQYGSYSVKLTGLVAENSRDIGDMGKVTALDWTMSRSFSVWIKVPNDVNETPVLRFEFVDSDGLVNKTEGMYKDIHPINDGEWRKYTICLKEFSNRSAVNLSDLAYMIIHLKVASSGPERKVNDVFIDQMEHTVELPSTQQQEIEIKQRWMDQLFCVEGTSSCASIRDEFPDLHAICWFNIRKIEECKLYDFRIHGDELFSYFISLTDNDHFDAECQDYEYESNIPRELMIEGLFPNPGSSHSTVRYGLLRPGDVTVTLYDILGRVHVTKSEGMKALGIHETTLPLNSCTPGLYRVDVIANGDRIARNIMVVR